MKNVLLTLLLMCVLCSPLFAAGTENLWTTGKIHVVLGVLLTILGGILVFLFVLERKISKLEKTH